MFKRRNRSGSVVGEKNWGNLISLFYLTITRIVRKMKADEDDIKDLELINSHIVAAFHKLKSNAEKASYAKAIYDKLTSNCPSETQLNKIPNENLRALIKAQVDKISKLKNPLELANDSYRAEYLLKVLLPIFISLTNKDIIDELEKDLNQPVVKKPAKAIVTPVLDPLKLIDDKPVALQPFGAEMDMIDIPFTISGDADPIKYELDQEVTQLDLMRRLSKQAGMNSSQPSQRLSGANVEIKSTTNDFSAEVKAVTLMNALSEHVDRLVNFPDVRTNEAIKGDSTYPVNEQLTHFNDKKSLYFQKFTNTTDANTHVVKDLNKETVLSVLCKTKTSGTAQKVCLTVPGNANAKFDTQALVTDHLRTLGNKLQAVSVKITSTRANGEVNVENVLKGAFNALHANLVPKFDAATWDAINSYAPTAAEFTEGTSDDKAYQARYLSSQFVEFIMTLNPTEDNRIGTSSVYEGFTELMETLSYDPVYLSRRP